MFAGVEEAPSAREIEKSFGLKPLTGGVFKDVAELDDGTPVREGDRIRFVIVDEPSFLDGLWDSAQENAEERADELEQELAKHGFVLQRIRVEGKSDVGNVGAIEVYVLEWEINAILNAWAPGVEVDPMVGATGAAAGTAGFFRWFLARPGVVAILGLATVGYLTTRNVASTFETSGPQIEGTFFWIAVAVVAASIAYSIGKLKGAPSA